jgi:hypothetical protein
MDANGGMLEELVATARKLHPTSSRLISCCAMFPQHGRAVLEEALSRAGTRKQED